MTLISEVIINKRTDLNPIWIMRQQEDICQNLERLDQKILIL